MAVATGADIAAGTAMVAVMAMAMVAGVVVLDSVSDSAIPTMAAITAIRMLMVIHTMGGIIIQIPTIPIPIRMVPILTAIRLRNSNISTVRSNNSNTALSMLRLSSNNTDLLNSNSSSSIGKALLRHPSKRSRSKTRLPSMRRRSRLRRPITISPTASGITSVIPILNRTNTLSSNSNLG